MKVLGDRFIPLRLFCLDKIRIMIMQKEFLGFKITSFMNTHDSKWGSIINRN